jgi:alpha-L-fucosidase
MGPKGRSVVAAALALALAPLIRAEEAYQPTPANLASRAWFRDARFGLFIHWGVYSALADGE